MVMDHVHQGPIPSENESHSRRRTTNRSRYILREYKLTQVDLQTKTQTL